MYKRYLKRILDVIVSLLMLIILSPAYLFISIFVRIKIGKPILFIQERPGKDERIFKMYKFRTMTNKRDMNGQLLADELRMTSFGKKLRSTSLDELPELLNILKGDMSFVGPRPLLVKYLPLYNEEQKKRHQVKPGITGLAQVSGRNAISWETKFDMDCEYVENVSFNTDLSILLKTIVTVIKREGINSETSETMEEFKGNDQ